jgi:hypothetical protein
MMRRERTSDTILNIYNRQTDPELKEAAIEALFIQQNAETLVALARKETNRDLKARIVQRLSLMRSPAARDYLMELLKRMTWLAAAPVLIAVQALAHTPTVVNVTLESRPLTLTVEREIRKKAVFALSQLPKACRSRSRWRARIAIPAVRRQAMFWLGSLAIPGHSPSSNRCFARSGTRACIAERGLQPRRPVPASRAGFSPRGSCRLQPPRARRLKPALYEQSSTNSHCDDDSPVPFFSIRPDMSPPTLSCCQVPA